MSSTQPAPPSALAVGLALASVYLVWGSTYLAIRVGLEGYPPFLMGSLRFLAEFAREPDAFLGLLGLGLSMGQWLSLPMVVAGVLMLRWALRRSEPTRA